ncbi:MAG: transposase [Planctomycetota bacterium]
MSTTSKSPRRVAAVALWVGQRTFPDYSSRFSPRTFTQAQLFACLVLKTFFNTDYRGIVAYLDDLPTLRETLGLERVPHYTTLQKAAARLLAEEDSGGDSGGDGKVKRLISHTLYAYHGDLDEPEKPTPAYVFDTTAVDSTGFDAGRASRYFVRRRRSKQLPGKEETTYKRFAKLGLIADCDSHLILATFRGVGPRPDVDQLYPTLEGMCLNALPRKLLADAGYDSEPNHEMLREYLKIDSLIPAKIGRPTTKPPRGRFRRRMLEDFDEETYGQRWQVETVMFMLKSRLGDTVAARTQATWRDELALKPVTHNVMIVYG